MWKSKEKLFRDARELPPKRNGILVKVPELEPNAQQGVDNLPKSPLPFMYWNIRKFNIRLPGKKRSGPALPTLHLFAKVIVPFRMEANI